MKSLFMVLVMMLSLVGCATTQSKSGACNALFAKFFQDQGDKTVHGGFYGELTNPFTFVDTSTMELIVYGVFDDSPESQQMIEKYKAEFAGTCVVPDHGEVKFYRLKTKISGH